MAEKVECPFCRELIHAEAEICRFCRMDLDLKVPVDVLTWHDVRKVALKILRWGIALPLMGLGLWFLIMSLYVYFGRY